jgi:hypothetical protein
VRGRRLPAAAACAGAIAFMACRLLRGDPVAAVVPPQVSPAPGPETEAYGRFDRAVADYLALRREAVAGVPPLKAGADAATIAARQKALAQAIRARRRGARAGEIFTPAAAPLIVRAAREELAGGADERSKVARENPRAETPKSPVVLKVNADYPPAASVSTMPPGLLLRLPRLPEGIEYRFVGKHLVLTDVDASIIVDYLLNVAP